MTLPFKVAVAWDMVGSLVEEFDGLLVCRLVFLKRSKNIEIDSNIVEFV